MLTNATAMVAIFSYRHSIMKQSSRTLTFPLEQLSRGARMPAMAMEGDIGDTEFDMAALESSHACKSYPSRGADGQQQAITMVVVIFMGLLERLAVSTVKLSRPRNPSTSGLERWSTAL